MFLKHINILPPLHINILPLPPLHIDFHQNHITNLPTLPAMLIFEHQHFLFILLKEKKLKTSIKLVNMTQDW